MAFIVQPTTKPITPPATLTSPRFTLLASGNSGARVFDIDPVRREVTYGVLAGASTGTSTAQLVSSTDGMLTGTRIYDFAAATGQATIAISYARILPNGEMIVSLKDMYGSAGGLYLSSGFPTDPKLATWRMTQAYSNTANYTPPYALDWAPKGHVREGLVVACEYGPQSVEGTTSVEKGASRAWVSLDYGKTWREVFNLLKTYGTRNMHMHGICYDAFTDRLVICFGDGYAGGAARSGILYSDDWMEAAPTWRPIVEPKPSATWQATLIRAFPSGLIVGSDGPPDGIWVIPRTPGGYAPPVSVWINPRTSGIGQCLYQASPNQVGLIVFSNGESFTDPVRVLMVSPDGTSIDEVYIDTQLAPVWGGAYTVTGPDKFGYVYLTTNDGRSSATLTRLLLTYNT